MDDGRPIGEVETPRQEPDTETEGPQGSAQPGRRRYRLFNREFSIPGGRRTRIAIGVALSVLGLFGFLPILGFWMIPLGLFILSHEFHLLRRIRRRWAVRMARRRARRQASR